MASLKSTMESTFAMVAYAERDMAGEARQMLDEEEEEPRPRKRATRQMAGQNRRQGLRAD